MATSWKFSRKRRGLQEIKIQEIKIQEIKIQEIKMILS